MLPRAAGGAWDFPALRRRITDDTSKAYRDTALKILTVAASGAIGYLTSTTRTDPRIDSIAIMWLAIIAIDMVIIGAISAGGRSRQRAAERGRQHAELMERLDKQDERLQLMLDAQQQTMRSGLIRDAERYCERGWITAEEHKAYSDAYGSYERLGLNGYIRVYVDKVDALPVREVDSVLGGIDD